MKQLESLMVYCILTLLTISFNKEVTTLTSTPRWFSCFCRLDSSPHVCSNFLFPLIMDVSENMQCTVWEVKAKWCYELLNKETDRPAMFHIPVTMTT